MFTLKLGLLRSVRPPNFTQPTVVAPLFQLKVGLLSILFIQQVRREIADVRVSLVINTHQNDLLGDHSTVDGLMQERGHTNHG